jgi:hypothetical protein
MARSSNGGEQRLRDRRNEDESVRPLDDDECRTVAEDIERQRPGWMVLWGTYSKRFVAFPLFPVQRRTILVASYPDALLARMEETERAAQPKPEPRG